MRVGINPQALIKINLKSLYVSLSVQGLIEPSTSAIRLEWFTDTVRP